MSWLSVQWQWRKNRLKMNLPSLHQKSFWQQKLLRWIYMMRMSQSEEQLLQWAMEMEDAARENEKVTNSDGANGSFSRYETLLVTSNGFAQKYDSTHTGISVSVIAGAGADMQTDYEYSSARHMEDLKRPNDIGKKAAERVVGKLNPKKVASGKYPIIFEPRIAKGFIGDLAKGINGAAIARGTSYLKNKLDEEIFGKEYKYN